MEVISCKIHSKRVDFVDFVRRRGYEIGKLQNAAVQAA